MLRFVVLCLVLTFASSRIVLDRNYAQKGPLDDWRHLEANEIPNTADDAYKYAGKLLFQHTGPEEPLKDLDQYPSTAHSYDSTTPSVEELVNIAQPEKTTDKDGYTLFPDIGRFKLHLKHLPFDLARDECLLEDGDFVVPDSKQKVAVLMKLYEMHPEVLTGPIEKQQIYLGIEDFEDTKDFDTIHNVPISNLTYLPPWAEGEPATHFYGLGGCVTIKTDARLRNVPCVNDLPFFCWKPL